MPSSFDRSRNSETTVGGSRFRQLLRWLGAWLVWCRPGLATGLVLWLSFPPIAWSWLAWIALVPLATLVRAPWRSRPIYRAAWAGGLAFGLLAVQWIRFADDTGPSGYYGWWALAFYLSLYFPLFLLVTRIAVLRFGVPLIVALPVVWVGLEYLRSWMLTGFPWYFLAHSQYRQLRLIQIADLAGAYGVSLAVALVNGWVADLLAVPLLRPGPAGPRLAREQVWRLGLLVGVLGAVLGYGALRLGRASAAASDGPRVALVQTNVPQQVKSDQSRIPDIHRQYLRLLDQATAERPELVIWPETAYRVPLIIIDPDVTDDDLRRLFPSKPGEEIDPSRIRKMAASVRDDLAFLARRGGATMLMGINSEHISRTGSLRYNTAVLVTPDGVISRPYHKIHLVPWGEYLPLAGWLPWLHWLTPHSSADYGLDAGSELMRFRWREYTFGVLICFEDTLPWAARRYVQAEPVDFLVNITNDGWFGIERDELALAAGAESPDPSRASGWGGWRRAEHESHLAVSVFRAVECRRPMLRAVNTGISAIIDANGHIVHVAGGEDGAGKMLSGVIVAPLPLDRRAATYVRLGDWVGWLTFLCATGTLIAGFAGAVRRRQRSEQGT